MKPKYMLAFALFVVVITSAVAFYRAMSRPSFSEAQAMLAIRWIGDQILRKAGDSTSRVLPVIEISPTLYHLEFQSEFRFIPDTLVKLVHSSLNAEHLPLNYTVNVVKCSTNTIVYGYRIGPDRTTLVPCLGREQPTGCYTIQIAFESNTHTSATPFILSGIAVAAFAFVAFRRRNQEPDTLAPGENGFVSLGNYEFSASRRILRYEGNIITLTDKESRLLDVLATHKNETVDRDRLMKEVWEDDGVIVGRSLDVFISKLRKKLVDDSTIRIVNIHGKGYKLEIA